MGDSISVDPELLRTVAGRLDVLFSDSRTTLRETDQAISDSRDGWKESASSAFGRFNTYLDGRRTMLQQNLAELAESLVSAADHLQARDESTGTTIDQLTSRSSSLNL